MDLISLQTTNLLPVAPVKDPLAAAYRLQRAVRRQQARDYGRRIRALWPHLDEHIKRDELAIAQRHHAERDREIPGPGPGGGHLWVLG